MIVIPLRVLLPALVSVLSGLWAVTEVWQERDLYDGRVRQEIRALNGVHVGRVPWTPDSASLAEAEHRRALYG